MLDLTRGREAVSSRTSALFLAGGISAMLAGILFLAALPSVLAESGAGPFHNWLVIQFRMNAGVGAASDLSLRALNPVDIAFLLLAGTTFAGLRPLLAGVSRVWSRVGAAVPFAGLAVLLLTGTEGRSAVMSGGLVVGLLLLRRPAPGRILAWVGILANGVLLVGDIGSGSLSPPLAASLLGTGYWLLTIWFLLAGWTLFESRRSGTREPRG